MVQAVKGKIQSGVSFHPDALRRRVSYGDETRTEKE